VDSIQIIALPQSQHLLDTHALLPTLIALNPISLPKRITKTKTKTNQNTVIMQAATETHNDLVNLLNETNIAITEIKAEAAQSAEAVSKIIEENCELKAENERLHAEIRELRIKLWDATEEERKMNAGRLRDVLKVL
jgi:regulator of replication initiation timing